MLLSFNWKQTNKQNYELMYSPLTQKERFQPIKESQEGRQNPGKFVKTNFWNEPINTFRNILVIF